MKLLQSNADTRRQTRAFTMYFDDHERSQGFEGKNIFPWERNENPWIISSSHEKRLALEKFLGYSSKAASNLSDEQVEEKTLRWVIENDLVLAPDDDPSLKSAEGHRMNTVKYDGIKDLLVASSCNSTLESLTFLWNTIADTFEDEMSSTVSPSHSSNFVKLIVFPRSEALWDYRTIVTTLEAIRIAMPLLPTKFDLKLDLFHPNFKYSPRSLSPHWHSPFPTIGLTIKETKQAPTKDFDIDLIRDKLNVLFQSGDAARNDMLRTHEDNSQVLEDCKKWIDTECERKKPERVNSDGCCDDDVNISWTQSGGEPFQLYRTVWNSALYLSKDPKQTSIIIHPSLDSYSLHRVAVTVNAALIRLDIPVRVTQVFHPSSRQKTGKYDCKTRPPYGMIQLSPRL